MRLIRAVVIERLNTKKEERREEEEVWRAPKEGKTWRGKERKRLPISEGQNTCWKKLLRGVEDGYRYKRSIMRRRIPECVFGPAVDACNGGRTLCGSLEVAV